MYIYPGLPGLAKSRSVVRIISYSVCGAPINVRCLGGAAGGSCARGIATAVFSTGDAVRCSGWMNLGPRSIASPRRRGQSEAKMLICMQPWVVGKRRRGGMIAGSGSWCPAAGGRWLHHSSPDPRRACIHVSRQRAPTTL